MYIPKNEKETRPLGISALENKIVERGITWLLESIYEQDFLACSYGYLYYGHASSHSRENVIIVDNLLAYEFVSGIDWQERDGDGIPKIELLGKHNSTYAPGAQTRHPHCQMSGNGKWISYNSQFDDRSDVYVLKMI